MGIEGKVLTIDVGNSAIKFGMFLNGGLDSFESVDRSNFKKQISEGKYASVKNTIVMSSGYFDNSWEKILPGQVTIMDASLPIPLELEYDTPLTLGLDRKCNAVAAGSLYNKALAIDLGTCITYDVVSDKTYMGGAISPGWNSRLRAMHEFTSVLPLLQTELVSKPRGTDTKSSMLAGAQVGVVGEVEAFISNYKQEFDSLEVVITGGDARYFANLINCPIFVDPYLTLKGLYEILAFNLL